MIAYLLQSIIERKPAWDKLNHLHITAVLYQDPYSHRCQELIQTLQAMQVRIEGILLLDCFFFVEFS